MDKTHLLKRRARNALNDGRLKYVKGSINKTNVNYVNREGLTPLTIILQKENLYLDTITYLIRIGGELKGDFELVLSKLLNAKEHNYQIIKMLLIEGTKLEKCDLNVQDSNNSTLMKHLFRETNPQIKLIKYLQKAGAEIEERAFMNEKDFERENERRHLEKNLDLQIKKGYNLFKLVFFFEEQQVNYDFITIQSQPVLHYLISLEESPAELIQNVAVSGRIQLNQTDGENKTALNLLFEKPVPNLEMIELFLQLGATVNRKKLLKRNCDTEIMPFENYVQKGHVTLGVLSWFGSDVAPITTQFGDEQNLLHLLTERGRAKFQILEYLINEGIGVNLQDTKLNTPLHYACRNQPTMETIQLLVLHGADFNLPNKDKFTPFHFLFSQSKIDTQIFLFALDNGAVSEDISPHGLSALSAVCKSQGVDHKLVKFLIEQDTVINTQDDAGNTPLHYYITNEIDIDNIQLMIEKGANINFCNNQSNTPLHELTKKYNLNEKFVGYLVEKGADFYIQNEQYQTPLLLANNKTSKIISDQLNIFKEKKAEKKLKSLAKEIHNVITIKEEIPLKPINPETNQMNDNLPNNEKISIQMKFQNLENEFSKLKFKNSIITELQKESNEKSNIINKLFDKILQSEKLMNEMNKTITNEKEIIIEMKHKITNNEEKIKQLQKVVKNNSSVHNSEFNSQLNEWKQRVTQLIDENLELKNKNKKLKIKLQQD
ncbi:ankyrin repeat-containing protein [Anaeramoeba flamelloides]|uniref:Ankyrin repeat-containing protein n=1 Tax=Anaeramoeba flamelloides TaxID=1746091 RepID=A0ABQ8XVR9_9EUKA|nr:ankyrin repeat-containing protein [Anaeramoeba flamelloides]